MKTRALVALGMAFLAGLAGWLLLRPAAPEAPPKVPAAKSAPLLPAATVPKAPAPVRVAAPMLPAVTPVQNETPAKAESPLPAAPVTFTAVPQADLQSAIATGAHFMETRDLAGLIRVLMPPDELKGMAESGKAATPEEAADFLRHEMPDIEERVMEMLPAMRLIQGQTPELNPEGTEANYPLDPPLGDEKNITFYKVDGFWYLK